MDPAGLDALRDAIRNLHHCDPTWIESVHVHEAFKGETIWDGDVQVFTVTGHPTATRAYAWSHATEGAARRFFAVLELPPVVDAVTAVRASIAAG
jgi:hypothetical protein